MGEEYEGEEYQGEEYEGKEYEEEEGQGELFVTNLRFWASLSMSSWVLFGGLTVRALAHKHAVLVP